MTANNIKEYGLSIGFSKVGITSADAFPAYIDEIASRSELFDFFSHTSTNPVMGATPRNIMPAARSVVVLVFDYFQNAFPDALTSMIGKIYLARCYSPRPGMLGHARLQLMKDYLSQNGCVVNADIGIPARWAAARAGVATFGRNNFAYADGIGSYIVIYTLVIDRELEYDIPTVACKCPPRCTACIDACPTKALYAPFKLNPKSCIPFNNWMTQDGRGTVSAVIPYALRESIGCRIHGCDICQDICPRNQKKLKSQKSADLYMEEVGAEITLPAILQMSDDYFAGRIQPVLYNYIREKRYFMRNAAVAMGNSQDESYVADLDMALKNPDEVIREHVAWALGRIGGARAKALLERGAAAENSLSVRQTMQRALAQI